MSTWPPKVRIRHASDTDIEGVRRCLAAAFGPYEASYTPGGFRDTVPTLEALARRFREMTVLVAEDESGEIIGTIAHQVTPSGDGHLRGMAVSPQLQGSRTAEQLLYAAEGELRALGCARVTLDTTHPLQRAIRFYQRRGYEATGRVTDFFGIALFEYAKSLRGGTVAKQRNEPEEVHVGVRERWTMDSRSGAFRLEALDANPGRERTRLSSAP